MNDFLLQNANAIAAGYAGYHDAISLPRELCQLDSLRAAWAAGDEQAKRFAARVVWLDPSRSAVFRSAQRAAEAAFQANKKSDPWGNSLLTWIYSTADFLVAEAFSPAALETLANVADEVVDAMLPLLVRPNPGTSARMLSPLRSFAGGVVLVALCRAHRAAFLRLMPALLKEIVEDGARHRRNSAQGASPEAASGAIAALALCPELPAELEALLRKLAGKKNVTPIALFALCRHGHEASLERLGSAADVNAVELDFGLQDRGPLYAAKPEGAAWLREHLLSGTWPRRASGMVPLARSLGVWDGETMAAWLSAVERDVHLAGLEYPHIDALNDDEFARVSAALREDWQRDALAFEHPRNTEEGALRFGAMLATKSMPMPRVVHRARALASHFDLLRARHPESLVVQLTLALAATPALPHASPNVVDTDWAVLVRKLEPTWAPERAGAAPKAPPKKTRASKKPPPETT